jgi:hypothetical protein
MAGRPFWLERAVGRGLPASPRHMSPQALGGGCALRDYPGLYKPKTVPGFLELREVALKRAERPAPRSIWRE